MKPNRSKYTSSIPGTIGLAPRGIGRKALFATCCLLLVTSAKAKASAPASNWTGTWAVAQVRDNSGRVFTNQTLRQVVRVSIGGNRVRLTISNLFGTQPLRVEDVHLALRGAGSSIIASSNRAIRFDGSEKVVIPAGANAVSDPATFDVSALAEVAISMYLPGTVGPATFHGTAHQTSYIKVGDASSAPHMSDAETSRSVYFLGAVEVEGPSLRGAIVALGASITEGYNAADDTDHRWPDQLALRLIDQGLPIGVLNLGISGNRLLADGSGESAENRFERDVLRQSNVRWVIFSDDAINDLGSRPSPSGEALIGALRRLIARAHEKNIRFVCSTLTPFEDARAWTPDEEKEREKINAFIRGEGSGCDGLVDQDAATHDPAHPAKYLAAYDHGDHLHPNDAGHKAIADRIDLKIFMSDP